MSQWRNNVRKFFPKKKEIESERKKERNSYRHAMPKSSLNSKTTQTTLANDKNMPNKILRL